MSAVAPSCRASYRFPGKHLVNEHLHLKIQAERMAALIGQLHEHIRVTKPTPKNGE